MQTPFNAKYLVKSKIIGIDIINVVNKIRIIEPKLLRLASNIKMGFFNDMLKNSEIEIHMKSLWLTDNFPEDRPFMITGAEK